MAAEQRPSRHSRITPWLRDNAAWLAVVATFTGLLLAGFGAWHQIGANRAAANERATVEQRQLAQQADDQLRLAAVSVVLDAPTCDAAIARAQLAADVLGAKLPADFVARVRSIRAVSFTSFTSFVPSWDTAAKLTPNTASAFKGQTQVYARLVKEARRAATNHSVPCKALEPKK